MSRPVSLLLRIATLSLFLGLAWIHLYWEPETPYAPAIERYHDLLPSIDPHLLSWSFGGWLLAASLAIIVWRPAWSVTIFVLLSMIPLSLFVIASFVVSETPARSLLGNATLLATPPILCFAAVLQWGKFSRFLARAALTLTFATFGLLATGLHYQGEIEGVGWVEIGGPQPETWNAIIAGITPDQDPLKQRMILRIFGGLALLAALGIWTPLMMSISALSMSFLAVAGCAVMTTTHLGGDLVETLHRWLPETILRMPLVILPLALWQMKRWVEPTPSAMSKRRKLRRVEPKPDEFEVIMDDDDDRFVSLDEIR